ncbi:MAG: hypothetical protein GF317_21390 [Candidatus Lokiarchaeota archaeon]|nr:hypothetical protein [Candidatus Lokiarchaeota archaeon]MBD3202011.1 hypothetical protein [Candidatus Lokiarchaeota archaeon]
MEILKALGLNDIEIRIYTKIVGNNLLTFEEIHFFEPDINEKELNKILETLIEKKLIIPSKSHHNILLEHFYAPPPFEAIFNIFKESNIFGKKDGATVDEESEDLENLKKKLNLEIYELKESAINYAKESYDEQETLEYINQFEGNLKKLFGAQFNTLSKLVSNLKETENPDLSKLESLIPEKIEESNLIISQMFEEFHDIIAQIVSQNATNIIEFNSLKLDSFEDQIIENISIVCDHIRNDAPKFSNEFEKSINEIVKFFSLKKKKIFSEFWNVRSVIKLREEISHALENEKEKMILIIPTLENYLDMNNFEQDFNENIKLKLVSSDSHNDDLVSQIRENYQNINFRQLKNNSMVCLMSKHKLIIGVVNENGSNELENFIGFGTINEVFKSLFNQIIIDKWNEAKPTKERQITSGFNRILNEINELTGIEIGEKLKAILDIAFEKDGISLKLLELKILFSDLSKIYTPLSLELKGRVIETIKKLNEEFSTIRIDNPPELTEPKLEVKSVLDLEYLDQLQPDIEELDVDFNKIKQLFEIFIEKLDVLKGNQISEQIDKMIDLVIDLKGNSEIINWKESLKELETPLDEESLQELKEDFIKWMKYLISEQEPSPISTKSSQLSPQKQTIEESVNLKEEYVSPGLTQEQFSEPKGSLEEVNTLESEEDTIEAETGGEVGVKAKLEDLKSNLNELEGPALSNSLQEVADILLLSKGAMAVRDMRNWISKLRGIRSILEEDQRNEFQEKIDEWIEKFD